MMNTINMKNKKILFILGFVVFGLALSVSAVIIIDVNGGIPGYQETEQYQLLNNSQLSQKISRIPVVEDHSPLVIDETYLFCVVDFGGQYPVVVNADQFAMSTSCSFAKEVIRIAPET